MLVFIELWTTTPKFDALTKPEQDELVKSLIQSLEDIDGPGGIDMVGWGVQSDLVDRKLPYDFFAIWRIPDEDSLKTVQAALVKAGWYEYVNQVNVAGELLPSPTDLPMFCGTN